MTSADRSAVRAAVVIPAYEAASTIALVVADARRHLDTVLVVDDGSQDGTAERATLAGADVVRHERNRGKGASLLTGMRTLAARGFTHALSMDADGQHLGGEIPTLLAAARAEPAAIIIGVRQIGTQEVAAANLFGNRFANAAIRLAAGTAVGDTQSGYRMSVPTSGEHARSGARAARLLSPVALSLSLAACAHSGSVGTTADREVLHHPLPHEFGDNANVTLVEVYYPPIAERRSHYRKVVDTLRIIRAVAPLLLRH